MWETPSYTLLHLPSSLRKNVEVTVPSALPMDVPEDANPLSSTCITSSLTESSEILLQIIPLKILGNNGKSITTYGLIDSGFDVTMIEPSLVDQHEIPGEQEQLFLPIVSQKDQREQGVKDRPCLSPGMLRSYRT